MAFMKTSERGDLLMLFALCFVYVWCNNRVFAGRICSRSFGCLQSCYQDECQDPSSCSLAYGRTCVQKGYGESRTYKLHCRTPHSCFQVCSLGSYEMICESSKTCTQQCYGNSCSATCSNDEIESCNQDCHTGDCVMECNSRKCYQQCYVDGCTANCTSDVDECTQICHAKQCSFGCAAKSCTEFSTKREDSVVVWHIVVSLIGGIILGVLVLVAVWYSCRKLRNKSSRSEAVKKRGEDVPLA